MKSLIVVYFIIKTEDEVDLFILQEYILLLLLEATSLFFSKGRSIIIPRDKTHMVKLQMWQASHTIIFLQKG